MVIIIGLGKTGLSCVDYFLGRGVTPLVMDTRANPPGKEQLPPEVELVHGLDGDLLKQAHMIVASPGIALATPELKAAAEFGVRIVGDIELFVRETQTPVIAITGSNGKSTVTTLVGEMIAEAGLKVGHYAYVGADNRLDVETMIAALTHLPKGDVVLLHACCHNPTGFDLAPRDWKRVLEVVKARELLPLIDFAYQGFGDGLEEDAWAVRLFAAELPELLITSSCSKNFGLYRERTGALIVCASDAEKLVDIRSQLAFIARNLWSTPPAHGAAVVAQILGDDELKRLWQDELEGMRLRVASLRRGLVEALAPHGLSERFAHIAEQRGMFSYTGLSPLQVKRLREEFSVYMVGSGRANVAGLDATRLDQLASAIAQVSL